MRRLARVCLLAAAHPAGIALAAAIAVTTTSDEFANNTACSLREAVYAANLNSNAHEDACTAGENGAADTITLANGATYSLTINGSDNSSQAGDLDIGGELRIDVAANGTATISQDGTAKDRVVQILSGAVVTLTGLTITGGDIEGPGVGLSNAGGTLTLNRVTVAGNVATAVNNTPQGGGIHNQAGGALTLNDSTVSNNSLTGSGLADAFGGGIYNAGTLALNRSTVANNMAVISGAGTAWAGGIYNDGPLTLDYSTVANNRAQKWNLHPAGGVIGGGILNVCCHPLTITNSTIRDNKVFDLSHELGGAGFLSFNGASAASITASCIVENGPLAISSAQLDATDNWWDAASGPRHPGNPGGSGEAVSNNVDYSGFRTTPPAFCGVMLAVEGAGTGFGTMTSATPERAITCTTTAGTESGDCTGTELPGTLYTITAAATWGVFIGWTGCDSTSGAANEICNVAPASHATVTANFLNPPLDFFTVTPCRLLDTRESDQGPALTSEVERLLTVPGRCGIPASASAVAINVTAVGSTGKGRIEAYPAGASRFIPTVIFAAGQTRSSSAVLGLAFDGSGRLAFRALVSGFPPEGTVHLIVDVVGYFE